MNDEQPTEPATPPTPYPDLTPRQRMTVRLLNGIGNDMGTGTMEEQHTAALLRLCADAVGCGQEWATVLMVRHWMLNHADAGEGAGWVAQWEQWNGEAGE